MKFIRIFLINFLLLTVLQAVGIAQDLAQIMFINELDGKRVATYGDALRMLRFQVGAISKSYTYLDKGYFDDLKLTKGMISLIIAEHLELKQSFMYRIFRTERYAYRACVAENLFSADGNENDLMSGPELIGLFLKVNEFKSRR